VSKQRIGTKLIGENYQTADLLAKVTGRAQYAEDYRAEGMLFCKLLLSPMPHARVRQIDLREAQQMPRVRAVETAENVPQRSDLVMCNAVVARVNQIV